MSDKHCFYCQLATSSSINPLKETAGGNHIHKACIEEAKIVEAYTDSNLLPKMKRKTKAKGEVNG